jgi:hypothetical protein
MNVGRRVSVLITAMLLAVALVAGSLSNRQTVSADAVRELGRAAAYFDSTIVLARWSQPKGPRGDQLAIELGYLERLRVGVGDPFRLADEALADPRLSATTRQRVAWALLERLRRGEAYVVNPDVLDGIGPWSNDGIGAIGASHLDLIERTIANASDPRAGELAVRLAYMLAAAKGSVSPHAAQTTTDVAALIRDRVLALEDVRDLLADANDEKTDVLEDLTARRASRSFGVEQPGLAPLPSDLQVEAMRAVPALVRAIDTLDRWIGDDEARARERTRATSPVIGPYFAERLVKLAAERPPTAQVVVTLGGYAETLDDASNEESLIAANARAMFERDSTARTTATATLSSAVAVRTLAQAAPWFQGMPGPTAADVITEFGLSGVTFARSVPSAWRPYYLRELQDGLRDMQRVFPIQSFAGLGIRFGTDALRDSALALHDPRTRTLQLSIATSGGTLAHELSHDIDWQASRRMFASGGGYNSDRVVREQTGALASSLKSLGEARPFRSFNGAGSAPPSDRPAELFARGTDWFVASVLAQQGRMNGFLSAIGDGSIAGYAAGAPTAVGAAATTSLLSAIEAMTYVPDSVRASFEATWADPESIDPTLLVRRVLDARLSRGVGSAPPRELEALLAGTDPQLCMDDRSPEARARKDLVIEAVDARARALALRRARLRAWGARAPWAGSLLGLAPWSPELGERVVDGYRNAIVASLANALPGQGVFPLTPPSFRSNAASCSIRPR